MLTNELTDISFGPSTPWKRGEKRRLGPLLSIQEIPKETSALLYLTAFRFTSGQVTLATEFLLP